jgi:hypothetical protein
VHWGVALIEATRIGGTPRQRHVAYLGSFTVCGCSFTGDDRT